MEYIKKNFTDIMAWTGSASILSAYIFHKSDIIQNTNTLDIMNMYGSLVVGYICYLKKAWQPLFLNCSWFIVGLVSLIFTLKENYLLK